MVWLQLIVRELRFVAKELELSAVIAADADEAEVNGATKRRASGIIRRSDENWRDDSISVGLSAGRPAVFLMDPLSLRSAPCYPTESMFISIAVRDF
jgi:hypothetical protein